VASVEIPCRNESLLYVLIYELLMGPYQKIRGGGALKRLIMKKETVLRDVLKQCSTKNTKLIIPRYVRINSIKFTLKDAISDLKRHNNDIYIDVHVPDLLVLQPTAKVSDLECFKLGKIILQDKSSCFSALCLIHGNKNPLQENCIDACAAPGQKTSHLASLLPKSATVYACDRNDKRLKLLQRRMEQLVGEARSIITKKVDFLATKQSDFPNAKGILLDPSCSGSGIFTSLDRLADTDDDPDRIKHLANFQLVALKHAMSFETVDRIVYSTCSIHQEENEEVVKQALESNEEWQLRLPHCLREWPRRGVEVKGLTAAQAKCLIRADRGDETNGFFVAYFERKSRNECTSNVKAKENRNLPDCTFLTPGKANTPEDAALYNGQFQIKENNTKTDIETTPTSPAVNAEEQVKKDATAKPEKVIAKKRAKKLAWKKRQMEQKKKRLLKKINVSKEKK